MLERTEVEAWLVNASVRLDLSVVEAHLFGSILEPEATPSDVDVVMVFREWDVRNICTSLKKQFEERFGHRLHVQMFHASQVEQLETFLVRAGGSRRLV
jgi:predicted nucleotidyltransferase